MTDWEWITADAAIAIHDRQLAEHGGPSGLRDAGTLESALARPQNLAAYGEPDAASLAAAYAFGIARNHPFVDGNKRSAWIVCRLFLRANGLDLTFQKQEAINVVLGLADGSVSEDELGAWLREHLAPAVH